MRAPECERTEQAGGVRQEQVGGRKIRVCETFDGGSSYLAVSSRLKMACGGSVADLSVEERLEALEARWRIPVVQQDGGAASDSRAPKIPAAHERSDAVPPSC